MPASPVDPALLAEIDERLRAIAAADAKAAGPMWGAVYKLLLKAKVDTHTIGRLVASRDLEGLARLAAVLRGDEPEPEAPTAPPDPVGAAVSADTMKKALRAFRKRVKLIRLDHESKLGVGPMTGGRKADFDAIIPPQEFGEEVWEALADAGQLRRAGPGFYMLGPEAD